MPKDRTSSQRQPASRPTPYGSTAAALSSLGGSSRAARGAAKVVREPAVDNDSIIEELISSVDVLVGQVAELNDQVKQAHLDVSRKLSTEQAYLLQEAALAKLAEAAIDCSSDTKSTTTALAEYLDHVTSAVPIGVDDRISFNSLLNAAEASISHLATTGNLPPPDTTADVSDLCFSLAEQIGPKHLLSLLLDSLPPSPATTSVNKNDEANAPPPSGSFHETLNTVLQSHLDLASQLAAETEQRDALAAEIRELVTQLRTSSSDEPQAFAAIIASAESAASHAAHAHLTSQLATLTADSRLANEELARLESEDHALLAALESQTTQLNTAAGIHAALVQSLNNPPASPGGFTSALAPLIQEANVPLADVAAGLAQAAAHVNQLEPEAADMSALAQMPPVDVHLAGGGHAEFADVTIDEVIRKWVVAREGKAEQVAMKRAVDHIDQSVRAAAAAVGVESAREGSVEQVLERVMGVWTRAVDEVNDANQEQRKVAEEVLQGLQRAVDVEQVVRERSNLIDGDGWSAALGLDDRIVERKRALGAHGNGYQSR